MSSPTLVCFDLGRVLVRICEGWPDAHTSSAFADAVPAPSEAAAGAIGRLVHAFEVGALTVEDFIAQTAALLERSPAHVASMLDAWVQGAYPGAVELLDELIAAGHAIACLSNTNARHWELMSAWSASEHRLWSRIGLRYASHELGARKPDAAIYAELERRSGYAPSQIYFFDDLPANVAAARARGWNVFEVTSREDPITEMRAILCTLGLL